jgi:hypothetical protein
MMVVVPEGQERPPATFCQTLWIEKSERAGVFRANTLGYTKNDRLMGRRGLCGGGEEVEAILVIETTI